jgi:anti-sigma regulatory factor (Ser/Thr protein kinase)
VKHTQPKSNSVFVAPLSFSIKDNPQNTIEFFNKILEKRREHKFDARFTIDVSQVIELDESALLYLIAIVNDTKSNEKFRNRFRGNFPEDGLAKERFVSSGFLNFVSSVHNTEITPKSDKINIINGNTIDVDMARQYCELVQRCCILTRAETIPLYNILVELMSNTRNHAYAQFTYSKNWYLFAEERDNYVNFVFLDTGLGIPRTVKRNFREKVVAFFGTEPKDSKLIHSALKGEFRTQTKEHYHGKGLPQISDGFTSGLLNDVLIFSGNGCCILKEMKTDKYKLNDYENQLFGSLFSWRILKRGMSR